jgi:hypothetical protein
MSSNLIILTSLIYAYVFIDQFIKGNSGMGLAYFGYAVSNVGLLMMITK